ncbi:MAG: hypothetical protein LUE25_08385 [Clostridiales bacterium]|nr:hypothetical protein [Clostridiales bacterium]
MKTTGRMLAALILALCAVAVFAASCADDLPLTITTDVGTVAIKSVENSADGSDETETVELCDVGDTLEIVTGQFIPYMSTLEGIGMKLSVTASGDTVKFSASSGRFLLVTETGDGTGTYQVSDVGTTYDMSLSSDAMIYWSLEENSGEDADGDVVDKIEIIVYENDNIIGAALLTVSCVDSVYTATLAETVNFPKIDGEYQNITEELVAEHFEGIEAE